MKRSVWVWGAVVALSVFALLAARFACGPGGAQPADAPEAKSPQDAAAPFDESAERVDAGLQPKSEGRDAEPRTPDARVVLRIVVQSWPDGGAIEGARVELVRADEVRVASARAQAAGEYEVELECAEWQLRAVAEGFHPHEQRIDVLRAQPDEGVSLATVELIAQRSTRVRARSLDGVSLVELARSLDESPSEFVETHTVLWWSRDGTEEQRALVTQREADDAPRFDLVLPLGDSESDVYGVLRHADSRGAWLSLTVGSASGPWSFVRPDQPEAVLTFPLRRDEFRRPSVVFRALPPEGAQFWLEPLESQRGWSERRDVDPDGIGRIEAVPPGDYMLIVAAPEHAEQRRVVRARLGRDVDLGTIRLEPAGELEVLVRDAAGSPLAARVSVGVFERGSLKPQGFGPRTVLTGEDGVARLPVSSGPLVVRARITGPARLSPLSGHDTSPLVIDGPLAGRRVELTIAEPAELGVSGANGRVAILDAQGVVVDGTWELGSDWGGYLQPGRYRVLDVALDGSVLTERALELRSGQQVELALR